MITRGVKVQLLAFFVIAVLGIAFVGGRYAGLGKFVPGHNPGYLINADFTDSGGIFQGAEVTYRGVLIGKVEKLKLTPDGVQAQLRLRPGTKIPSPSRAMVADRSAIGEQYVDLEPTHAGAPYLAHGATIDEDMTGIPIQPSQLVFNLNALVTSVNDTDVTTVLNELGDAFNGTGDDLQRLIDAGNALTATATTYLPQTQALIRNSLPVLNTQRQVSGEFKAYLANLTTLTAQLRASDPDFRKLYANGIAASQVTQQLLEANRANLPPLLDNLVFTAQVMAVRIPAIRQILVTYPNVVAGGFTVTPGDNTAHFGFVTTMTSTPCPTSNKGYASTKEQDPSVVANPTPNLNAYCDAKAPSTQTVRGAQNAPRAEGLPPFPADRSSAINQSSSQASLYSGLSPTDGYTTGLADYDPTSGHAISADGQQFTVSSTAGAYQTFGNASWEWLLMNPLTAS